MPAGSGVSPFVHDAPRRERFARPTRASRYFIRPTRSVEYSISPTRSVEILYLPDASVEDTLSGVTAVGRRGDVGDALGVAGFVD